MALRQEQGDVEAGATHQVHAMLEQHVLIDRHERVCLLEVALVGVVGLSSACNGRVAMGKCRAAGGERVAASASAETRPLGGNLRCVPQTACRTSPPVGLRSPRTAQGTGCPRRELVTAAASPQCAR